MYSVINTTEHNLSRYSIPMDDIHPLVRALRLSNINTDEIEVFINGGTTRNPYRVFPRKLIGVICNKLRINIILSRLNTSAKVYTRTKFPNHKRYEITVKIGSYGTHYYIQERLRHLNYSPTATRVIFQLTQMSGLVWSNSCNSILSIFPKNIEIPLENIIHEQTLFQLKYLPNKQQSIISYADIECVTLPYHVPIMYGRVTQGKLYITSTGYDSSLQGFRQFLKKFPKGYNIVYFHNLKYDWSIIKNSPDIRIISILKNDGIYYCVKFMVFNKYFEFRDSYKYIPRKLADFAEMFDIPPKIDCILYDVYTKDNTLDVDCVTYRDLESTDVPQLIYTVSGNKVSKVDQLSGNISDYIFIDSTAAVHRSYMTLAPNHFIDGIYYHLAHMELYLARDCELLASGMEIYKSRIDNLLELDCHSKLTLPSLVHDKMCNIGCYTGLYQLSDNLRRFVSLSVHGGRVVTRDNKMWDLTGDIHVLDGRSLYPSAIDRICNPTSSDNRAGGFPQGLAKQISGYDHWNSRETFFHYVVRIKITAIRIYQHIPFVTYYKNSTRIYTNNLADLNGESSVIDKITLEDWVKFQGIEYEFLEGIYWDSGGNKTAEKFVNNLYTARREYANAGNESMSQVCKLALNSLFGKTIVKPVTTKNVIRPIGDTATSYIQNNFENIRDIEDCGTQKVISVAIDDINHSNLCQVGGLILSMSRRIMNELLDLANTLGIVVVYTDTDSMHIYNNYTGISRLEVAYAEVYGRQLLGTKLGQFALELKFPGHTDVVSSRIIVLGKKAYMHVVTGKTPEGIVETYNYCRMKGVNTYAMDEFPDKLDLYNRLYSGESIKFDLAYGNSVVFQIRNCVTTRGSFVRRTQFLEQKGFL